MNVRIEAVAMSSTGGLVSVKISTENNLLVSPLWVVKAAAVSVFRPISVNGHSLSAVAPDNKILGGVAVAA